MGIGHHCSARTTYTATTLDWNASKPTGNGAVALATAETKAPWFADARIRR